MGKLPFWIIPAHWGLSGKAKIIARINYYSTDEYQAAIDCAEHTYLTDYEIDRAKNDISLKYQKVSTLQHKLNALDIELKHGRITDSEKKNSVLATRLEYHDISEKDYDAGIIDLMVDGEEKHFATIEYAYKYHDITEREYSKELYTLRKEPWMDFDIGFNEETNEIEFSFDYNEYFWKKLKAEGHPGNDEDEIIENFIRDWGRKVATDDYSDDYDTKLVNANTETPEAGGLPEGYKMYK
jgi:hypothetical protein